MKRTGNSRSVRMLHAEERELEVYVMYGLEEWREVYLEQLGKYFEHTWEHI